MKKYNIHIYKDNILPIKEISTRHPFHIVVALEHKSSLFDKNINGESTIKKACLHWSKIYKEKDQNDNIFKFSNSKGSIYIRLPLKSYEEINENKKHKMNFKQIKKIAERILEKDHNVFIVESDARDQQKEIIEYNEALAIYTDIQYRSERINEYVEDTRINQLTPEQVAQAKFSLGEKEYERRIKEGIPIIF